MGFWTQVKALVRKDFRIFMANKKASLGEVLFPIVMGIMTGVFILLVQVVENNFSEYDNVDTTTSITNMDQTVWFGVSTQQASAFLTTIATYLQTPSFKVTSQTFNDSTQLNDAYFAYQQGPRGNATNYIALNANGTKYDLHMNVGANPHGYAWSLAYSLADVMTASEASGYPQTVRRRADHESLATIPNLRAIFSSTGCMMIIYAFIPSLILTAGRLVEEKRVKVRESLKVMSLSDLAYLTSNFLSSILRMAIGTGLISVCLAIFKVIDGSDIPAVFAIGLFFALSLIAFAQIMPSLFNVSIWSNVVCIILLSGSAAVSSLSTGWTEGAAMGVCLLSPVAFYYALLPYMASGTITLLLTTQQAAIMLAVDTVIYAIIANYIYAVAPGEFGVPKHPLFFIRWIWHKDAKAKQGNQEDQAAGSQDCIVLQDLMKYFGEQRETPSVNKLSLNVRHGEIFALLGHNGAGKTTTISILTGMITPTTYAQASVNGLDISEQMDDIRKSVGLCPQFDVLFNDLTARQHLELFSEIKGFIDHDRINYLMESLELPDTDQKSATFSGGTKRRLSVGNALVGGATLLYLDEPSSGMDPLSRRKMWDLLKAEKEQGKTIVLTTHFMEEADYLGERIAIMSRGRLFCCDTSQQLKERFGVGYYLVLVKKDTEDNRGEASNVNGALKIVQKHVPEAVLHHESSGEAQLLLPISAVPVFAEMLADVEKHLQSLHFHSYGLSMNTLEDVFVNISEREEAAKEKEKEEKKKHQQDGHVSINQVPTAEASSVDDVMSKIGGESIDAIFSRAMQVSKSARTWNQIRTVFWRKVLMLRRSRRMQLMIILFPVFFIVLAFLTIQPQAQKENTSTSGLALPNFLDMTMINFNLRDGADNAKVLQAFQTVYTDAFPGAQLTVYEVNDMNDYGSGRYVPMKSMSFVSGFKSPDIVMGFLPHHMDLSASPPFVNYTFLFNKKFSPAAGTQLLSLYNTALERAVNNTAAPLLVFQLSEFPSNPNVTDAPTAAPVYDNDDADAKEKTYNFMQVGLYTVIAVVQLVSNCAIPVADELQRQVYHANRVQGMSAAAYFIGNLLFDFLCCIVPMALLTLMIFVKQIGAFYSSVMIWVLVAGFMFCIHVVLQSYVLVTYVRGLKPVTYTGIIHGLNLVMLGAPYLCEVVLNAIGIDNFLTVKSFILALTPPCAFYHILDNASDLRYSNTHAGYILTLTGDIATAWGYIFMLIEYLLPLGLLYAFAAGIDLKQLCTRRAQSRDRYASMAELEKEPLMHSTESPTNGGDKDRVSEEDPDVRTERSRVTANPDENMVSALNLVKHFGDKHAVNDVTFGIRKGECFGLLGPNGAGKSTTCNLILRDLIPTSGEILFPYANVTSSTPNEDAFAASRIGVCNQGDSLWEFLSAAEHMDQYLRLRLTTEYEPSKWKAYINKTIEKVYLADAGDRFAGGYSGGMKRKLLVCLAMYTGARTVFLDEPSTGMDPFSRRALWSVILEALSQDRSVLLTTHSMEEADAVCSRISIITAGHLQCIGSSQHLKNRFGSGYVLTLVHDLNATTAESVDAGVQRAFPGAQVQEVLGGQRRYGLGKIASLAQAFRTVQDEMRDALHLQQYSISQTVSLEQIFLSFVATAKEGGAGHEEVPHAH